MLTLVKPFDQHFEAVNQRLLLIPLIFSRGALTCSTDHPEVVAVSYQARGAALLADRRPPTPRWRLPATDRLAVLVGRGRAQVLRALSPAGHHRRPRRHPRARPEHRLRTARRAARRRAWCTAAGSAGGCCTAWNRPAWPWSR